jgi:hypothetical protein
MASKVIYKLDEVDTRLGTLGLERKHLTSALLRGDAGAGGSTALHPPTDAGFRRWSETTTELRVQLIPFGGNAWKHSNALGYCTVYNTGTQTAIVVMQGNGFTGSRARDPRSKYPKGVLTEARILFNQAQGSLFPEMKSPSEITERDCTTWILVQWADEQGAIHAELSHPIGQDSARHVTDWYERILLPNVDPGTATGLLGTQTDEPDVDFPVRRTGNA